MKCLRRNLDQGSTMMAKTVWVKESDLMMYKLFNKYIHKIFAGVHIHNVDVEEKNFPFFFICKRTQDI